MKMSNVNAFERLVNERGSSAVYHREDGGTPCPCLTPEGYRDLKWHRDHPLAPVCNERGMLPGAIVDLSVRAFVQPVQSGATRRLTSEYIEAMFGDVRTDDHVGIFPLSVSGVSLDFEEWSEAGEDYVVYRGRRFLVVNSNLIPDPADGEPHHWEVGLRLMTNERPT